MNKKTAFYIFALSCLLTFPQESPTSTDREYYQFKTYILESDEQVKTMDEYLKNALLPALKRIGIDPVGVFKHHKVDSLTERNIHILIPFSSLAQFEELDGELAKDPEYLKVGEAYIHAPHDRPPYKRIRSTLSRAFTDRPHMAVPKLTGPRENRIYELRSYEGATEELYRRKVDMFNAGNEVGLFDRLHFNAIFYAEVLSGSQMPNLMYLTAHENQEARDANWKAFFGSPEWEILKEIPKYKNTVSRNETLFLYPTDYSGY